jgi:hypothetical protein
MGFRYNYSIKENAMPKFHVQLERTIDIVVEAPDRASLSSVLNSIYEGDADVIASETNNKWTYAISSAQGPAPATYVVTPDGLAKT